MRLAICVAGLLGLASAVSTVNVLPKRGLLFPWNSVSTDLSNGGFNQTTCPKAVYAMNWEAWRPGGLDSRLGYIAMARTQSDVSNLGEYMPTNGAKRLAFLNEPDLPGSTQLDPTTAAQLWHSSAVPYRAKGIYLISPAVTSDVSLAVPWMDSFLSKVSDAKPDALALHYYGTASSDFVSYVTMMQKRYNMDIWVTEVASTATTLASVTSFLTNVTTWADQQPWLRGLFWFDASRSETGSLATSALMGASGQKLALGSLYCGNTGSG